MEVTPSGEKASKMRPILNSKRYIRLMNLPSRSYIASLRVASANVEGK